MLLQKKRLIGKLVLESEDEITNTTGTLLNYKKIACAKRICLIHTVSLVMILLLLLAVICVSCYFCCTKYESKQPFCDINIKSGEIRH